LGYSGPHFPLANHYAQEGEEWMYGRGSHDKLTQSGDWREKIVLTEHRYMLEDVGIGLAWLAGVARLAGVAAPLVSALLALGSAICGVDFLARGRSLASLGLGELSVDDLKVLLQRGFR
jgi:opine dehydrogenase